MIFAFFLCPQETDYNLSNLVHDCKNYKQPLYYRSFSLYLHSHQKTCTLLMPCYSKSSRYRALAKWWPALCGSIVTSQQPGASLTLLQGGEYSLRQRHRCSFSFFPINSTTVIQRMKFLLKMLFSHAYALNQAKKQT